MPLIKLSFTPALLLLVLSCPVWQLSFSLPLMPAGRLTGSCVSSARTLRENIADTLTKRDLFIGINCSQVSMEVNTETQTASACAPKGTTCIGVAAPDFDQVSCLKNIKEDLHYYYRFLAAEVDPQGLLRPTVDSIKELMENCFPGSQPTNSASKKASADDSGNFDHRLHLCKVLKGFQVRSITVNRAIGHMSSGECTK